MTTISEADRLHGGQVLMEFSRMVVCGEFPLGELTAERLKVCGTCPHFKKMTRQCGECHCFMDLKTRIADAACPKGYW